MLCDALARLHPFDRVENYRYIGFGSIYFSDFHLFHRSFGMTDMLSIEKDEYAEACFEFNKPFNCIRLDCRPAAQVLPGLDWKPRTIVWLDYDGKLDEEILSDIDTVSARAPSGSVLLVSVNVQPDYDPGEDGRKRYSEETKLPFELDEYRLRELRKRIGDALPPDINGRDLRGKGVATVSYRVIQSQIQAALSARNAAIPPEQKMVYQQVFNFWYSDNAQMLTVGGVFFEPGDQAKFAACEFEKLHFARLDSTPYPIEVPCLTMKEIRHLNAQLPLLNVPIQPPPSVPPSDVKKYVELYRYFATFIEAVFL